MNLKFHAALAAATFVMIFARPTVAQNTICSIYPTRCLPYYRPQPVGSLDPPAYPGGSPIYTPDIIAPRMGMVVRDALNPLLPAVRQSRYPREIANAVRPGGLGAAIDKALRTGVDPPARIIDDAGPRGAAYTNKAAMDVMNVKSPTWKLVPALSPNAIPLDRSETSRKREIWLSLTAGWKNFLLLALRMARKRASQPPTGLSTPAPAREDAARAPEHTALSIVPKHE